MHFGAEGAGKWPNSGAPFNDHAPRPPRVHGRDLRHPPCIVTRRCLLCRATFRMTQNNVAEKDTGDVRSVPEVAKVTHISLRSLSLDEEVGVTVIDVHFATRIAQLIGHPRFLQKELLLSLQTPPHNLRKVKDPFSWVLLMHASVCGMQFSKRLNFTLPIFEVLLLTLGAKCTTGASQFNWTLSGARANATQKERFNPILCPLRTNLKPRGDTAPNSRPQCSRELLCKSKH